MFAIPVREVHAMTRRFAVLGLIALTVSGVTAAAQEMTGAGETDSTVPALNAFHEIIYPIWHTAYPEKDTAALKGFVPRVNELAAAIYEAKLPGILREKEAKWQAGVAELKKAVEAYASAAGANEDESLLKAAETLHMRYEMLVRIIRPVLPEIEAFHKILYVVYHTSVPGKKWQDVRAAAPELKEKAEAIAAARLPQRLEAKSAAFKEAAAELLRATAELASIEESATGDVLERTVEKVHTRYQTLEKIFD
jgi:hypothetical protein